MKKHIQSTGQQGYTLIELLLYIGILGFLLMSITFFLGPILDSGMKNQTISKVDTEGALLMNRITQTIRNATSITTPAAASSGPSLSLVVPTGALSPSVFDVAGNSIMGFNADGGTTDTNNQNIISITKFTAATSGTVATLYALLGTPIAASPNNLGQMAIYAGTSSAPTTLLASSASIPLSASGWNAFPISPVTVTAGQVYWLGYNTNATSNTANCLRYLSAGGSAGQVQYVAQTYGTWPTTFSGGSSTNDEFSVYADILPSSASAEIKEGVSAAVAMTSSSVQVVNLNFTNLKRTGTNGIVQVTFTLARINPANRNEYDYKKTFTSSSEVGW